jgi:hypothetical protein
MRWRGRVTASRALPCILGIALLCGAVISQLVLFGALSGHPATTAIGVALLPLSLFCGILLLGGSIAAFRQVLRAKSSA